MYWLSAGASNFLLLYNIINIWSCSCTLQTHKWVNAESMLEKCFIGLLKRNSVVKMKPSRSGMFKDHVYSCCTLSGFWCVNWQCLNSSAELFIMIGTWLFLRFRCLLDLTAGLLKEAVSCQRSGAILLHDLGWVLLNIVTALQRPVSSAVTQVIQRSLVVFKLEVWSFV